MSDRIAKDGLAFPRDHSRLSLSRRWSAGDPA
jgi:hypothetical protein